MFKPVVFIGSRIGGTFDFDGTLGDFSASCVLQLSRIVARVSVIHIVYDELLGSVGVVVQHLHPSSLGDLLAVPGPGPWRLAVPLRALSHTCLRGDIGKRFSVNNNLYPHEQSSVL